MKKHICSFISLIILVSFFGFKLYAQIIIVPGGDKVPKPPAALTYQGEARDSKGNIIKDETLEILFIIKKSESTTVSEWKKPHEVTTDKFGLFAVVLGDPGGEDEDFNKIPWSTSPMWLQVIVTYKGEDNDMGSFQFLSVPYAMHAETADYVLNDDDEDADADPTNELQNISLVGTTLSISDGNDINLPIESITEEPGLILDHVILRVPGMQDREVLKIGFSITRQRDDLGRLTSILHIDAIKIKVAALDDGNVELADWMSDPFSSKDGDIDYIGTNGQILRPLSFKFGYLISYKEIYEPKLGLIEEIVISPREMTTGDRRFVDIRN